MAAFNTIIAREGFVEEVKARLNSPTWDGLVAESEDAALPLAGEKFETDALRSDWEVAPDSIEAYEIFGESSLIGWDIEADGWPMDRD